MIKVRRNRGPSMSSRSKSSQSKTTPSSLRRSKAWKAAEFEYESLHAMSMVPWMGRRPQTPEKKIAQLKALVHRCPNFYPAVMEMAILRVARGQGKSAEKQLLDGFNLMLELAEPKKLAFQIATTFSNLEKFWRYDLCRQILEPAVKRLPRNADLRDSLACALGQLGEFE